MKLHQIALGLGLAAMALTAGAQSAARKSYIVELVDLPVAGYDGRVAGLKATRPTAGAKLQMNAGDVQAYLRYLDTKRSTVTAAVPSANVFYKYRVSFNGFAAKLTDAEFAKLAAHPGVAAITLDEKRPLDTSRTPSFMGIDGPNGVWSKLDGSNRPIKGENVIIAHVDSGIWPENPSVSDKVDAAGKPVASHLPGTVVYNALPAGRYKGLCEAGLGFTSAMCNNKLIGARYFNTGWKNSGTPTWSGEFLDSPRDPDGHGTHTLTTAGGNQNTEVDVGGSKFTVSGIAPRARLAAYKVCYTDDVGDDTPGLGGCFPSDSIAAIDQAVADGVDVINFSISGSRTSFRDGVEVAFLFATQAGVFVAASAGNSGPGNTVAHISPWVATVGNSTHDRYTEATVTLGNGATVAGASFQTAGLPASPLLWSRDAGATDETTSNQSLCFGAADGVAAVLNSTKVSGKILICERGGNALVNKVANAAAAGAVGVIIANTPTSANSTPIISAVLPTVHTAAVHYTALTDYSRTANPVATMAGSALVPGTVAPVMATSSSRGPNQGDLNVLKPDITAPGTDIIAAYTRTLSAAERAGVIAGTLVPGPGADMISGTSMSSPHVAGAAALMKQANPTWSPYAIKSALMTSALQNVKLASGATDTDRWGFGSGHLNPNGALDTKMVYDTTFDDYVDYYFGAIPSYNLNLASITRANVVGIGSMTRKLTNKGSTTATFTASASLAGFTVTVSPASMTLAPGATGTYTTTLVRTTAPIEAWRFGEVNWSDGTTTIRSPLTAKASELVASSVITDSRAVGTKVYTVGTGYAGSLFMASTGMVANTANAGRSVLGADDVCFPITVPSGAKQLRVQMLDAETEGGSASDLDVTLYRGATAVAASAGGTSDELITLTNPTAGSYTACVEAFGPVNGAANFVLHSWVVGPAVGTQSLKALGASRVVVGGTATVAASWNTQGGKWYLGVVEYRSATSGPVIGRTTVLVDARGTAAAAVRANPVSKIKLDR